MLHQQSIIPKPTGAALLFAFALATAHQYLFYGNAFGVSVVLFVGLFYIYLYRFAKERLIAQPLAAWGLLASIVLLSATYALFDNPLFYRLNLIAIPILVLLHVTLLLGNRSRAWWTAGFASDAVRHILPENIRQWGEAVRFMKASAGGRLGGRQRYVLSRVGIGLAIAVPLLMIVVKLLASADGVFHHVLSGLPDLLNEVSFGEGFARALWIAAGGMFFFGYLSGFWATDEAGEKAEAAEGEGVLGEGGRFRIDPIIVATVLIAVSAVYVLFVAVQFSYLFGAWEGLLPEDQTYAEYARSGFSELVTVSIINFILLIGALRGSAGGQSSGIERVNQALLYVVVGCSAVMLYSAYMRLVLYEEAYGYTYIRFLVHAFMLYLAVLMGLAAVRIRYNRLSLAKMYFVVSVAAYVLINYAGMDRWIAVKNLERYEALGTIDNVYLGDLSADAVPVLVRFAEEHDTLLVNQLVYKRSILEGRDRDWPAFNLARHRAASLLEAGGYPAE